MIFIIILSLFTQNVLSYHFNAYPLGSLGNSVSGPWNIYPDHCCQLEWENITLGQSLPEDAIIPGSFYNKKWAFTRTSFPTVALKPDSASQEPNWLGASTEGKIMPYPILTNPNKCVIGWYRTRFIMEPKPQNDHWFFPNAEYHPLGAFIKHNNYGGRFLTDGNIQGMNSDSNSQKYDQFNGGAEMLYVDCYESRLLMSTARLHNISFNGADIKRVMQQRTNVVHVRKRLRNSSPERQENTIDFSIETSNNATVSIKNTIGKFTKLDKGKSNRDIEMWLEFLARMGVVEPLSPNTQEKFRHLFENVDGSVSDNQIFSSKTDVYRVQQTIKLPPYSLTMVRAHSHPYKGQVPFKAVYELTPSGTHTVQILSASLKKYGFNESFEVRNDRTLLVKVEGRVDVNAGHEVDVDIHTMGLDGKPYNRVSPENLLDDSAELM